MERLEVRQKPMRIALKAATGETVLEIMADIQVIEGLTLAVHKAVVSTGDETTVSDKGWQVTEPETGFRFCGGPLSTREKAVDQAANVIRKKGLEEVKKHIESKLEVHHGTDNTAKAD